jgi:hypothetical protein
LSASPETVQSFRSFIRSARQEMAKGGGGAKLPPQLVVSNTPFEGIKVGATYTKAPEDNPSFLPTGNGRVQFETPEGKIVEAHFVNLCHDYSTHGQRVPYCKLIKVPARTLQCTDKLTTKLVQNTTPQERTASTELEKKVEAFGACSDEAYNTFIMAAVLNENPNDVKQIISRRSDTKDLALTIKPREGVTFDERVAQVFAEKKKLADQLSARGGPIFQKAIRLESGSRTRYTDRDAWGHISYYVPPEVVEKDPQLYCAKVEPAPPACHKQPSIAPLVINSPERETPISDEQYEELPVVPE